MIRLKRLKCGENGASQDSQLSGNCVSCLHACSANSLVGPSKDVVSVKISINAIDRAPYIMWLSLNFTLTMSIIILYHSHFLEWCVLGSVTFPVSATTAET